MSDDIKPKDVTKAPAAQAEEEPQAEAQPQAPEVDPEETPAAPEAEPAAQPEAPPEVKPEPPAQQAAPEPKPEAAKPEPQPEAKPAPVAPAEPKGPKIAAEIPISHLDSKRLMQLNACTRCGECLNWCPVYDQDGREDILPRKKAADFLDIIKRQHGALAKMAASGTGLGQSLAKLLGHKAVTEDEVEAFVQSLYECSTCGQCQIVCPTNLDTVNLWEEIRRLIVMAGYGPLEQQKALVKSVKSYDNPWQQPRTARAKWARRAKKEKLIPGLPPDIKKKGGKILLYLGCTASYDANVRQVAVNTVNILERMGIDYGILGKNEACCGSVMLRMGDPEYERVFNHNIELFNSLGVEALVTSCAGCYKTINDDYPRVGKLNFEVLHTVQFMRRLIEAGEMKLTRPVERVVTYHDPCHLGRASGVYDDPRFIMEHIPGLKLAEMPRSREYSRCCGAGGGLKSGFPDVQNLMSQERVKEAMATGASELVSCCPFCFQGLQVGINALESPMIAQDLTSLVIDALEE